MSNSWSVHLGPYVRWHESATRATCEDVRIVCPKCQAVAVSGQYGVKNWSPDRKFCQRCGVERVVESFQRVHDIDIDEILGGDIMTDVYTPETGEYRYWTSNCKLDTDLTVDIGAEVLAMDTPEFQRLVTAAMEEFRRVHGEAIAKIQQAYGGVEPEYGFGLLWWYS